MVQKFFRIFTVLNLLFLFSCSPEKKEAILSVDTIDRIDTFVYTDSGDLLDLIGQKKDFVLTIAQVGCETCKRIQAPMKAYIQTTSLPIYWIEIQEYRKTVELLSEDEEYRLRSIVASASLLLFDDGKDIRYIEYDPKIYASEKAFPIRSENTIRHRLIGSATIWKNTTTTGRKQWFAFIRSAIRKSKA